MYILVGYIHKVSQNFDIWNIFPNISWNSVFFGHFLPFSPKFLAKKSSKSLIFSGNIGLYWLKIGTTNLHSSLHLFPKGFFVKVIFSWNMSDFRPKIAKNSKFPPKRRFRSFITSRIFREFSRFCIFCVKNVILGILNKNWALWAQFSNFIAEKPLSACSTPPQVT